MIYSMLKTCSVNISKSFVIHKSKLLIFSYACTSSALPYCSTSFLLTSLFCAEAFVGVFSQPLETLQRRCICIVCVGNNINKIAVKYFIDLVCFFKRIYSFYILLHCRRNMLSIAHLVSI